MHHDKGLIRRWIEALRSDDYKQGTGRLRDRQGNFCCLGVLADLRDPGSWKLAAGEKGDPGITAEWLWGISPTDRDEEVIPNKDALEISYMLDSKLQSDLASMNDEGKSFVELADIIERKLLRNES